MCLEEGDDERWFTGCLLHMVNEVSAPDRGSLTPDSPDAAGVACRLVVWVARLAHEYPALLGCLDARDQNAVCTYIQSALHKGRAVVDVDVAVL